MTLPRWFLGAMLMAGAGATEAGVTSFGRLPDGREVRLVTLASPAGAKVAVMTWGAAIQSVLVPDRQGRMADVTLGHASLAGYLAQPEYFGATVGRVANRIARGGFTLDGKAYRVPVNNGPNSLHGGKQGFDKQLWELVEAGDSRAVLRLVSRDGDQGYPGTLTVTATFTLQPDNTLAINYVATTDRPTVVNLSNHAYWNLAGEGNGTALDHLLTIPADSFLPVDADLIPTGEFRSVAGTPFDFRQPRRVGARVRDAADAQIGFGRGYDHNWVIARDVAPAPRLLARLVEPASGRTLEVHSDQPGLQFYSGNFLDGSVVGKSGRAYRQGDTIVLEPQKFPDTPNRPAFGSVRLAPGDTYRSTILFRFGVESAK